MSTPTFFWVCPNCLVARETKIIQEHTWYYVRCPDCGTSVRLNVELNREEYKHAFESVNQMKRDKLIEEGYMVVDVYGYRLTKKGIEAIERNRDALALLYEYRYGEKYILFRIGGVVGKLPQPRFPYGYYLAVYVPKTDRILEDFLSAKAVYYFEVKKHAEFFAQMVERGLEVGGDQLGVYEG